jgi:alanine racemase
MKTYIEINRENLVHNLNLFKKLTQKKLMFVVKANAYGHGLKEIVGITKNLGIIEYYAVDSVSEALQLKQIDDKKKILVLGWSDGNELETLILNGFETVAPSIDFLKTVDRLARKLKIKASVHLKVETGTGRMGMPPESVLEMFSVSPFPYRGIDIVGIYSHFANIEDTTNHSYAQYQLEIFQNLLDRLNNPLLLKHFSCSASTLLFPETYFDIVRVGISGYGYWPSKQTYISHIEQNKNAENSHPIELKPVLSWYAGTAQVKTLGKGDAIGYGLSYRTFNKTKIIIVPVGYYDGYDRKLSNISTIIVNGVKAPVRGRICMDMFMAEVTHIKNIQAGDRVTLLGRDGNEAIDANELAELAGTINYEILARINPLIPRTIK